MRRYYEFDNIGFVQYSNNRLLNVKVLFFDYLQALHDGKLASIFGTVVRSHHGFLEDWIVQRNPINNICSDCPKRIMDKILWLYLT